MTERDRLICRMRKDGHTCAAIRTALQAIGHDLSHERISSIASAQGIRTRTPIGFRVAQITPPRPTVKDPDAYMARKMKRQFEDIRFNRPVPVSEPLARVVGRLSKRMGGKRAANSDN